MDRIVAVLLASALVATGTGAVLMAGDRRPTGPAAAASGSGTDDERPYDWWPKRVADGEIPSRDEATRELEDVGYVEIHGNDGFSPAAGLDGGSGTPEDPYVIAGVYARELEIRDTDAWFTVRNSYIETLRLNWNDQGAWVHHNYIGDLRVNENDPRVGNATGGVVEANEIGRVGQIRHFDGLFRDNVVAREDLRPAEPFSAFDAFREAVNVDGYVNAEFVDNEIHGEVVLDLHGHGHASCRGCHPHNHYASLNASEKEHAEEYREDEDYYASAPNRSVYDHDHDHSHRVHTIVFRDNLVVDDRGRGIYVEDRNHAGDDRTANSEPDPQLIGDHVHDVKIVLAGNTVEKAGIEVDVMVAEDEYHLPGQTVEIRVVDNVVASPHGTLVDLDRVRNATVLLEGNELTRTDETTLDWDALFAGTPWTATSGVRLDEIEDATVTVADGSFANLDRGVAATRMPTSTTWRVVDNEFTSTGTPVWWDDTVANDPERGGDASEG